MPRHVIRTVWLLLSRCSNSACIFAAVLACLVARFPSAAACTTTAETRPVPISLVEQRVHVGRHTGPEAETAHLPDLCPWSCPPPPKKNAHKRDKQNSLGAFPGHTARVHPCVPEPASPQAALSPLQSPAGSSAGRPSTNHTGALARLQQRWSASRFCPSASQPALHGMV